MLKKNVNEPSCSQFLKKLWSPIEVTVKHNHLVLNELIRVKLLSKQYYGVGSGLNGSSLRRIAGNQAMDVFIWVSS